MSTRSSVILIFKVHTRWCMYFHVINTILCMPHLMVLFSLFTIKTTGFYLPTKFVSSSNKLFSTHLPNPIGSSSIPSGICAVYKPKGWTSHDVVGKLRAILEVEHKKRTSKRVFLKVGHGGTLDPLAEGVLVVGIGEGTKLLSEYLSGSKGYMANGCFGTEFDTLDSTGKVVDTKPFEHITHEGIRSVIPQFTGDIMQVPPMFSALKRDGKILYDLARQGVEVDREPRPVKVYKLNLIDNAALNLPHFELEIECGGGFYVRSLISDLAKSLNSAAHMTDLIRTKQSVFTVSDCLTSELWNYDNVCNHVMKCSKMAKLDPLKLPRADAPPKPKKKYYPKR